MCITNFLQNCVQNKTEVKVFLTNKTMLTGRIITYDDVSFILEKCLVLIHNTISIDPK
jgi:sRNA-binding regulator protein Hfq